MIEETSAAVAGPEGLMDAEEVAAYLKVEVSTVKQWVKLGKIPHGKAGSVARFYRADIDAWVRGNGNASATAAAI